MDYAEEKDGNEESFAGHNSGAEVTNVVWS